MNINHASIANQMGMDAVAKKFKYANDLRYADKHQEWVEDDRKQNDEG